VQVVLYLLAPIYSYVLARTRVSTRNAFLLQGLFCELLAIKSS